MIAREPLQRLLSAYKERYVPGARNRRDSFFDRQMIVLRLRPDDFNPKGVYEDYDVSFSEFIQYFSNNITRKPPYRQYEKMCHPCVMNYDFIGHFETMGEEGPLILKKAGIDDRVTFPPIHKATKTSEVLEYFSQVPPEYIARFGELYRNDYEMFGYEYLGPVKKLLNQSMSMKVRSEKTVKLR